MYGTCFLLFGVKSMINSDIFFLLSFLYINKEDYIVIDSRYQAVQLYTSGCSQQQQLQRHKRTDVHLHGIEKGWLYPAISQEPSSRSILSSALLKLVAILLDMLARAPAEFAQHSFSLEVGSNHSPCCSPVKE